MISIHILVCFCDVFATKKVIAQSLLKQTYYSDKLVDAIQSLLPHKLVSTSC